MPVKSGSSMLGETQESCPHSGGENEKKVQEMEEEHREVKYPIENCSKGCAE